MVRKLLRSLFVVFFVLAGLSSHAQQYLWTAATATANTIPFASGPTSNLRQYIYYPTDFPTAPAGNITTLYIKASAAVSPSFANLTIKMGHTALNTFTSGPFVTGLTTVYNGPYSGTTIAGNYVVITLQTPFPYNAAQNFIVEFSQTGNSPGFSVIQATAGVVARSIQGSATAGTGSTQDRLAHFGFDLVLSGPPCSGTPSAGTISGPSSVCTGGPVNLVLNNYTTSPGISIQWESSPLGSSTWTPISGATFVSLTTTQSSATEYRAVVTCSNGGGFDIAPVFAVTMDPLYLCYCSPYTGQALHSNTGNYITNVVIPNTTLSNATGSAGPGGHTRTQPSIPTQTASLMQVTPYTINVTVGAATYNVVGWIDYDQSNTFDAGEFIQFTTSGTTASATVTVPATALTGLTGMRLRAYTTTSYGAAGACSSIATGFETEDYVVTIVPATQCSGTPSSGGTVTSANASICTGTNTSLSVSGYPFELGITLQWEESPAGASAWTAIPNATTPNYTTPALTSSMDYRVIVTCSNGGASTPSNTFTVTVNSPQITGTTPASRCGPGTVTLSATPSASNTVNWYTTATGGAPLATATTSFITPVIGSTTTYYAAPSAGGINASVGLPAAITSTSTGVGLNSFGLVFDVLSPFTLNTVTLYPVSATNAAGTVTIVVQNSAGTVIHTATVPVTGSPAGSVLPQTVNLNFAMQPGTSYKLAPSAFTGISSLLFEPAAGAPAGNYGYPFTIPGVVSITTSTLTAAPTNTPRNDLYYYFYNWQISTGCEGSRVPVVATVTSSPSVTVSAAPDTICQGTSSTLTATSANTGYTYTWTPGGGSGSPLVVSPSATTKYYLNAVDGNNCSAIDSVTVVVKSVPATVTTNAVPNAICVSGSTNLSLSPVPMAGIAVQWQRNTGAGFVDIPGATSATFSDPVTTNTSYQAKLFCNNNLLGTSTPVSVAYNNPSIVAVFPGSRCSTGQVALGALPSQGASIKWYAGPTGGASLGSGNAFITPSISASTTYYAEPTQGAGGLDSVAVPIANGTTTGVYFHMFLISTTTGMTLNSLGIKCNQAIGTLTNWDIYYRPNNYQLIPGANTSSAGWTLLSSVTNVPSAGAAAYTTIASGLSLTLPPGSTYSFHIAPVGTSTHQYATNAAGTVTASNTTASIIAGHRGSLFNCGTASGQAVIKANYTVGCIGTRVPVAATINGSPSGTGISTGGTVTGTLHADGTTVDYMDACLDKVATVSDGAGGNVLGATSAIALSTASVQTFNGYAPYVPRVIDIAPTSTGPATVTLYVLQSEFDAYNNYIIANNLSFPLLPTSPIDIVGINNIVITQFHGNALAGTTGPGGLYNSANATFIPNASITKSSNGTYWSLTMPVTGFSGFFIHTGATPLSVDIKSIMATNVGNRNRVDWVTSKELPGDKFDLERSADGRNFSLVGTLDGKGQPSSYSYWDEQPLSGINYYRLKMIHSNGDGAYSQVVSATLSGSGAFVLESYPNPVTGKLTVKVYGTAAANPMLTITDVTGKIVRFVQVSNNEAVVDMSGLAQGTYMVKYTDAANTRTIKVNKH